MAKIYFYKFKELIDSGEETLTHVLNFRMSEVPDRWRGEVIDLLTSEYQYQN